jgi:serine protease SohB
MFLVLMIGQQLPGVDTFWPFNKLSDQDASSSNRALSPLYAELRSDMYGHERQFPETKDDSSSHGLMQLFLGLTPAKPTIPINTGIPKQQHISLTHLNREYEAYQYIVNAATISKAHAAIELRQVAFKRALEKTLSRLTEHEDRQRLTVLEDRFLKEGGRLVDELASLRALLVNNNTNINTTIIVSDGQCSSNATNATIGTSLSSNVAAEQSSEQQQCNDNDNNKNNTPDETLQSAKDPDLNRTAASNSISNSTLTNATLPTVDETRDQLSALGISFFDQIAHSLAPGPGNAIRDALEGHVATQGYDQLVQDLRQMPMHSLFQQNNDASSLLLRKRLFVTHFVGDMLASAVSELRKEVTAIVRSAKPAQGDEVLIVLQSAGGTVTGYGLVAAQLLRIKEAGLPLTVAVEQVAASGGYMAACVADTIVCSPFAVVGSIGVVLDMPNAYERLKREGVEFHQITAGEFKRVLSPTKEVTDEDLKKAKEEIEDVWTLFKDFVSEQRPALDIDLVATGEVWFGKRALEVGLCDAVRAADDVLTGYVDQGYDVYRVQYKEPAGDMLGKILEDLFGVSAAGNSNSYDMGLLRRFFQKGVPHLQDFLGKFAIQADNWDQMRLI